MYSAKVSKKTHFPALLHLSYILQQKAEEILDQEAGVGLSAARILSVLSSSKPSSQRAIAMELKQTEANVSRQLQGMMKQSLVSIARNKKDRRQRDVLLTSKGIKHYLIAEKLLKKQQTQLFKILKAPEVAAIEQATQKLV